MRTVFNHVLAWSLIASVTLMAGTTWGVDFKQSTGDELYDDGEGNTLPYRLFTPQDYCADIAPLFRPKGCDIERLYPLVIYFHGAGERGKDNKLQANGGGHMENLYKATQGESFDGQYQALLLAPQCPANDQWVNRDWSKGAYTQDEEPSISQPMRSALAILDDVIANYQVDTNRIYVTGLSMGGYGTWDAVRRRPELFAAAMPLSGGGNKDQGVLFKEIPVWTYHSDNDFVVPVSGADDMRDAIKNAGGMIDYTRVNVGHSGWGTFYDNKTYTNSSDQTVYEWLFSQSLASSSSDFETWRSTYSGLVAAEVGADSDADGLTDRQEYVFGLNPTLRSSASPITVSAKDDGQFTYTRRDPALTGLNFTIQCSSDLTSWKPLNNPDITLGTPDQDSGIQTVTVQMTKESLAKGGLFVRVQAE